MLEALQSDRAHEPRHGLFAALARRPVHFKAVSDVLRDRQPREQGVFLKHHATVDTGPGHRFAVDLDRSGIRADEAPENVEERALSAAGGSDDGDELAFRNVDVHVGQGWHVAVPGPVTLIQVLDAYADHAEQG